MIKPINNHILIKPIGEEKFMATEGVSYQEKGEVLAVADGVSVPIGCTVLFDSWLCAKYPSKDGDIWLVRYEDVRALDV